MARFETSKLVAILVSLSASPFLTQVIAPFVFRAFGESGLSDLFMTDRQYFYFLFLVFVLSGIAVYSFALPAIRTVIFLTIDSRRNLVGVFVELYSFNGQATLAPFSVYYSSFSGSLRIHGRAYHLTEKDASIIPKFFQEWHSSRVITGVIEKQRFEGVLYTYRGQLRKAGDEAGPGITRYNFNNRHAGEGYFTEFGRVPTYYDEHIISKVSATKAVKEGIAKLISDQHIIPRVNFTYFRLDPAKIRIVLNSPWWRTANSASKGFSESTDAHDTVVRSLAVEETMAGLFSKEKQAEDFFVQLQDIMKSDGPATRH